MKKLHHLLLTGCLALVLLPEPGQAIPAFARKYGFNCNMCHTAFTKLNDFGQRFRDNGYQIPGQEGGEKSVFDTPIPLAIRTSTGLATYSNGHGSTMGFNIFGFDLLAGGVLNKNVSFLMIYTPRIDEPAADADGPGEGDRPSQLAGLESVSLVFSNIVQDKLNVRVGRFEPAYHAFSSKRKFQLFTPYEIYAFTSPANAYNFDDNQLGVEATGHFRSGFKYGLGLVNGNGGNPDQNKSKDLYLNLSQTIGKGDGQSAGQRIGVFGYYGRQPLGNTLDTVSPTGEIDGSGNASFVRFGANGSFNLGSVNLLAMIMNGRDDQALNTIQPGNKYNFSGGFVGLDWAALMNNRLVTSLLYNWIQPPDYDKERKTNIYSLMVRYYLGNWSAVNVALHLEYLHRTIGDLEKEEDNSLAILLDFAF